MPELDIEGLECLIRDLEQLPQTVLAEFEPAMTEAVLRSRPLMTLPKKGQHEQAQAGRRRCIGRKIARKRVQREAQKESPGRSQALHPAS